MVTPIAPAAVIHESPHQIQRQVSASLGDPGDDHRLLRAEIPDGSRCFCESRKDRADLSAVRRRASPVMFKNKAFPRHRAAVWSFP